METDTFALLLWLGLPMPFCVAAEASRRSGVPQADCVQTEGAEGKAVRVSSQEEGCKDGLSGICTGGHHWQAASFIDM